MCFYRTCRESVANTRLSLQAGYNQFSLYISSVELIKLIACNWVTWTYNEDEVL